MKVTEPTKAEWNAPILFASRRDGSLKFCVEYWKLNAVTKRESYTIPRMDKCIEYLGDAFTFPLLTLTSATGKQR